MFRDYATDHRDFGSISAEDMTAYLKATGWKPAGHRGQYAAVFSKEHNGRERFVTVPMVEQLDDHADRIRDAITVVSDIEKRPNFLVRQDLEHLSQDSVFIASNNGIRYTPLSMSKSAELLRAANDLMCNSARAAEAAMKNGHKAAFTGSFSNMIGDLLDNIRYLHDHQLGYSLTLFSPSSGDLTIGKSNNRYDRRDRFAAATTTTLAGALDATKTALEESRASQSTAPFQNTVASGVSANLCDALARLATGGGGVTIEIQWSSIRDVPLQLSRIDVTNQDAEILQTAAHNLRRDGPYYNETIECHVIELARTPTESGGHAVLRRARRANSARIFANVDASLFTTLMRAFRDQSVVFVTGDLYSMPGGLELRNPRAPEARPF